MDSNVSVRDLRNHGGEVLARVQSGETLIVTSSGTPVAELRPISGRRLSTRELIAQRAGWAPVDAGALQRDIDELIDQSL